MSKVSTVQNVAKTLVLILEQVFGRIKGTVSLVRACAAYFHIRGNKTAIQSNNRDFATKSLSLISLAAESKWRLPVKPSKSQLDWERLRIEVVSVRKWKKGLILTLDVPEEKETSKIHCFTVFLRLFPSIMTCY